MLTHISVKNFNQETFKIEIEDSLTIKHLKEKLKSEKAISYSVDRSQLIYDGLVLNDSEQICSYNINKNKFVVVMRKFINKTQEYKIMSKDNIGENGTKLKSEETEKEVIQTEGEPNLKKPQCVEAERSGGINEGSCGEGSVNTNTEAQANSGFQTDEERLLNTFNSISNNSQFQRIRSIIQREPEKLIVLMQHIARSSPELMQIINQNQEVFIHLLNQPSHLETNSVQVQTGYPLQHGLAMMPQVRNQRQQTQTMSEQDHEAIERLKCMGFEENLVIQAYFACEKDENAAANFLIQQQNEE